MRTKGRRETSKFIDARTPEGEGKQKQDTLSLHGYTAKRLTSKDLTKEGSNRYDNRTASYNVAKRDRKPASHLNNMLNIHKQRAIKSSAAPNE